MTPADLPALAARLREAQSANFQLGLDVIAAFVEAGPMLWMQTHGDPTASIDSIVALARAVIPGVEINMTIGVGRSSVQLVQHGDSAPAGGHREAPLALCLALVEWRIAHGG